MSVQVPKGYQQTEVGVIPEDWQVKKLSELASFRTGPFGSALHKSDYITNGVPVINPMHIIDGQINPSEDMTITEVTANKLSEFRLNSGEVIIGRRGDMGRCAVVREENSGWLCGTGSMIVRPKNHINPQFLQRVLASPVVISAIEETSVGSTMINLNQSTLGGLWIQAPSALEQQAIAEALSDADALIESLEQLITKKRQIKQGAMQELLTGQRRLPGFSGEWEVKKIDEIADCLDYLRIPINDSERRKIQGDYPYCGANGILDYIDKYCIDDDVVLIAEDGGYFDEYATRPIAYRMKGKFWVNNHVHILKSKSNFDQLYLYYSLVHKNILPFLASGTRAKLNKSEMSKITIHQPINKVEQTAIASILSDIDSEIASLDSRLAKARQIKQSMMQELLTGRIRLI